MRPIIPLLIFVAVLLAAGTLETAEQADRFSYCMQNGVLITDQDIEDRINLCEGRTGYTYKGERP